MLKIQPVTTVKLYRPEYVGVIKNLFNINKDIEKTLLLSSIPKFPVKISSFVQEFNRTVREDDYFQLGRNPVTGKKIYPDNFQRAAGMNLYLGNDVLVTAPTGSGKTAIAEYIITKNLKNNLKTYYTTPLKALSNEKFLAFKKIYGEENVGLLTGDTKINPNAPVLIMTTEVYRNMVAARMFHFEKDSCNNLDDLQTVVFDELQYLGDVDRGGIWEQSIMFTPPNVQILSLSATIGNNEEINNWIASLKGRKGKTINPYVDRFIPDSKSEPETVLINIPSEKRNVPLDYAIEQVSAEIKIPNGLKKKDRIRASQEGAKLSKSIYAKPSQHTYKYLTRKLKELDKLPAIYFIFSKRECRKLLDYLTDEGQILTSKNEREEIQKIIDRYNENGIYLGSSLNYNALFNGYAIHNAGLMPAQKMLIEELFQKKLIKVVLATETISAGINMPARTTIISAPRKPSSTPDGDYDNKRYLTPNEFHQMAGRAGRRGIDTEGRCYALSCNKEQTKFYEQLINSPSNPLSSNLELDYSFITTYMSEFLDENELRNILSKSFYVSKPDGSVDEFKLDNIMARYNIRKSILLNDNYIDENNKLAIKGHLIKVLNGYEQIPIINILHKKTFLDLDSIQIAGIVAGLANIKYHTGDNNTEQFLDFSNNDLEFISAARDVLREVNKYEADSFKLYPDREIVIDSKVMELVYKWAYYNSKGYAGKDTWEYLFSDKNRLTTKEEGALYKEIAMTIDLLKQLINATHAGELYSDTESDKKYYSDLRTKLQDSINLIQNDPINPDKF